MRVTTFLRLFTPAVALLATACDDTPSPQEPRLATAAVADRDSTPDRRDVASSAGPREYWADGYLWAHDPTAASYTPDSFHAFNRSGGAITVTKPAGTTGRYVATFRGLSALLGGPSTVHVTGIGSSTSGAEAAHCKPVTAYLVSDKVEVRCFKPGAGVAVNSPFTLLVRRNDADLAFAYAHQSTSTNYAPHSAGSFNPAGTSRVTRYEVGHYLVTFNGLGAQLPPDVAGHVQVNAVGTSTSHCSTGGWGGSPNMAVEVWCFTAAGAPVDARFTVLFLEPSRHLAYAWADAATAASYSPSPAYSSNPAGDSILIVRLGVGRYSVTWRGVSPAIFDEGNAQVTISGGSYNHCKLEHTTSFGAQVRCFAPNGVPIDAQFTVLLGS